MSSTDEDVALLRICERPEEFRWMNFYPLERASSIPPRHRQVFVYGYAWELTRGQRSTGQAKVISRVTLGELMDKGPLPYDSDRNLIVSYDPGDMNPKGRSGGGIWFPPSLGKGLFNLDEAVLAGVQVAYFWKYRGKPLLATRVEYVRARLSGAKRG
jgi:hypothetical protein